MTSKDLKWLRRLELRKPGWSQSEVEAELWREEQYLRETGLLDEGQPTRYATWKEQVRTAKQRFPWLPERWPR